MCWTGTTNLTRGDGENNRVDIYMSKQCGIYIQERANNKHRDRGNVMMSQSLNSLERKRARIPIPVQRHPPKSANMLTDPKGELRTDA